jgi:hypothetical protein
MVSEQILSRLYRADEDGISDIISPLSRSQRAELAVFCYARSHLRAVGLAIADTCDLAELVEASGSNALAQTLLAQAQGPRAPTERLPGGRRRVTLSTAATAAKFLAAFHGKLDGDVLDDPDLDDDELDDSASTATEAELEQERPQLS